MAQRDVRGGEILPRAHPRFELHLFQPKDHKDTPGDIGEHSRKNQCAKIDPRFRTFCNKGDGIVTYEHGYLSESGVQVSISVLI
jgi:hypothetical protein